MSCVLLLLLFLKHFKYLKHSLPPYFSSCSHVHSLLHFSSKPCCLLWMRGPCSSIWFQNYWERTRWRPPLLLFLIFREALDIDGSSIKILMLQLKVAGRRRDWLSLDIVLVATFTGRCIPSQSTEAVSASRDSFVSYTPEFSFQSNSRTVWFYFCFIIVIIVTIGISCQLVEATLHWTVEGVLCVCPPPMKATCASQRECFTRISQSSVAGHCPRWKLLGDDSWRKIVGGRSKQRREDSELFGSS